MCTVLRQGTDRALVKHEVDVAALHAAAAQDVIDDGTGTVTVYRIIDVSMVRVAVQLLSRNIAHDWKIERVDG